MTMNIILAMTMKNIGALVMETPMNIILAMAMKNTGALAMETPMNIILVMTLLMETLIITMNRHLLRNTNTRIMDTMIILKTTTAIMITKKEEESLNKNTIKFHTKRMPKNSTTWKTRRKF